MVDGGARSAAGCKPGAQREVRESGVNLGVWRVLVVFEATGLDKIIQEVRGVGINGEES